MSGQSVAPQARREGSGEFAMARLIPPWPWLCPSPIPRQMGLVGNGYRRGTRILFVAEKLGDAGPLGAGRAGGAVGARDDGQRQGGQRGSWLSGVLPGR